MQIDAPEDFAALLGNLPPSDGARQQAARERLDRLTKPPGSLGRLEDLAVFLAGWAPGHGEQLNIEPIQAFVFAGNHGIAARGVSPYPSVVTAQMVENFRSGGAAINVLARVGGLRLHVEALRLDRPTGDISREPAMSAEETLEAINLGMRCISKARPAVIAVGEMGIGNTTIAAALSALAFGGQAGDWVGPGTGLDLQGQQHKAALVEQAVARARQTLAQAGPALAPFVTLQQAGGRELAAIAGAVLAARHLRIPVILDGYVATAAMAPLVVAMPQITRHVLAGHLSAEPAHRRLLQHMGLDPLLNLGMRLGEGTGAALAAGLVRAAAELHNTMATFESASVENRPDAG